MRKLKERLEQIYVEFGLFEEEDKNNIEAEIEKEVLNKLDRSAKLDEVDTITFGLETDDGKIVKVYVKAEQADDFEKALSAKLGEVDDIEQALNDLSKEFEIVDVEWPEESAEDPEVDAAEDGSAAMNAEVYKNNKEKSEEPKLEGLTAGELATLGLYESDGTTIESRLNTTAQLMVYQAILELGIPEVALNRNPYRAAIIKGIRNVAHQLSRNTSMKQALKMFVKKSIDHDEKPMPDDEDLKKESLESSAQLLVEGAAEDFWMAFNTLIKYIAPDSKLAGEILNSSKLQQLLSRSNGALSSRVGSTLRRRLNDLAKAIETSPVGDPMVSESASIDEISSLITDLLAIADSSKGAQFSKQILATLPFKQLFTKMKIGLSQKFAGQIRAKLNTLKLVASETAQSLQETVQSEAVKSLTEEKCKWELERTEDGLSISCGFLKMVLGEEDSEKLAKSIAAHDAIVVKDIDGKKYVFSPRGLTMHIKAVGDTTKYAMEMKDVDKLAELAIVPEEESEEDPKADDKKVKESLASLGSPTENKPGTKTWSYTTFDDFQADCKRLKYATEKLADKVKAKNLIGAVVGEFSTSQQKGWLRQK